MPCCTIVDRGMGRSMEEGAKGGGSGSHAGSPPGRTMPPGAAGTPLELSTLRPVLAACASEGAAAGSRWTSCSTPPPPSDAIAAASGRARAARVPPLPRATSALSNGVTRPYCSDGIAGVPKGGRYYDYDTGLEDTYPKDGIHAYCFEKAGATYIFSAGSLRSIIDSD